MRGDEGAWVERWVQRGKYGEISAEEEKEGDTQRRINMIAGDKI